MVRIAALRALAQRFSFLLLLMASVALMMLGKVDAVLVEGIRSRVADAVSPILDAFSRPAAMVAQVVDEAQDLSRLREENRRLAAENATLRQFRDVAYRLEAENLSLRLLLNYRPEQPHAYIAARVVGDNSGAFVRSLMINLGTANGVHDGQAVLGPHGLAGRIVQAGQRSARILLVTDLNSRIPVVIERSRYRGILGGDNSGHPRLLYLAPEARPEIGDRVVTSGHDGVFPPGLPVGTVSSAEEGAVRVRPMEDFAQLEYVRVVEFRPSTEGAIMVALPSFMR